MQVLGCRILGFKDCAQTLALGWGNILAVIIDEATPNAGL